MIMNFQVNASWCEAPTSLRRRAIRLAASFKILTSINQDDAGWTLSAGSLSVGAKHYHEALSGHCCCRKLEFFSCLYHFFFDFNQSWLIKRWIGRSMQLLNGWPRRKQVLFKNEHRVNWQLLMKTVRFEFGNNQPSQPKILTVESYRGTSFQIRGITCSRNRPFERLRWSKRGFKTKKVSRLQPPEITVGRSPSFHQEKVSG